MKFPKWFEKKPAGGKFCGGAESMKTAKAHNDQLTGSIEIMSRSEIRRLQNIVPAKNPNLRVIEWKPYPENRPERKWYIVMVTDSMVEVVDIARWTGSDWLNERVPISVTAFAELPEPYKENK